MYFALEREWGATQRDQRGAAATKLPGSMKAIPKLEARNAGAKSRQQHLPAGEENARKHEEQRESYTFILNCSWPILAL